MNPVAELEASACDVCVAAVLTSPGSTGSTIGGQPVCEVTLNTPFVRKQAQRARVPARMLAAMAMLHEQALCLGSRVPYAAEQRLADRLHNPLLLDLSVIGSDAGAWGVPLTAAIASALVHEQEHCVRDPPDDRETPALDGERRLARKLGSAQLLDYVTSLYRNLDRSGHWKS